jgi:hypothetical protein
MNAQAKIIEADAEVTASPVDPLAKLREPFPRNLISKLPKPTKAQTDAVKADFKKGIRCKECGSWHHPDVVHLDYIGHAALTDRLLDTDPQWSWEPVAFTAEGLPAFDKTGGLWIRLTVCGVTRLGYGHADPKPNQDSGAREKEVIGDALRNAAMRFGAGLELWHKGDLHAHHETEPQKGEAEDERDEEPPPETEAVKNERLFIVAAESAFIMAEDRAALTTWKRANAATVDGLSDAAYARITRSYKQRWDAIGDTKPPANTEPKTEPKRERGVPANAFDISDDEIPY